MIDQGRHSIVPFYAQGSKKVYYYNFYYLQAVFFCCGLGIPALCEELNRTNHWHKNTPYSTLRRRYSDEQTEHKLLTFWQPSPFRMIQQRVISVHCMLYTLSPCLSGYTLSSLLFRFLRILRFLSIDKHIISTIDKCGTITIPHCHYETITIRDITIQDFFHFFFLKIKYNPPP